MKYLISKELMREIIEVLSLYQFETVDENEGGIDEINNDEVIELVNKLNRVIKKQNMKK